MNVSGSHSNKVISEGHNRLALHGRGGKYSRQDAERLFRKLVLEEYLKEDLQITNMDHAVCYLKLGKKAQDVLMGKVKVFVKAFFFYLRFSDEG